MGGLCAKEVSGTPKGSFAGPYDYKPSEFVNSHVQFTRESIVKIEVDAIVNAANRYLVNGGGINGLIHHLAGAKNLEKECSKAPVLYVESGCDCVYCCWKAPIRLEYGHAYETSSMNLSNCKFILHTVGPDARIVEDCDPPANSSFQQLQQDDADKASARDLQALGLDQLLSNCYTSVLETALKNPEISTVAFPCISTGIFKFPPKRAAIVALKTVRDWLDAREAKLKGSGSGTDEGKEEKYSSYHDVATVNVGASANSSSGSSGGGEGGGAKGRAIKVIFTVYEDADVIEYKKLLPVFFPPTTSNATAAAAAASSDQSSSSSSASSSAAAASRNSGGKQD